MYNRAKRRVIGNTRLLKFELARIHGDLERSAQVVRILDQAVGEQLSQAEEGSAEETNTTILAISEKPNYKRPHTDEIIIADAKRTSTTSTEPQPSTSKDTS